MRRTTTVLSILAASLLLSAAPGYAAEADKVNEELRRDECLLVSMNCANEVDSIQQRIERLHNEIARGTEVYTMDELNTLHRKLNETIRQLEVLTMGG